MNRCLTLFGYNMGNIASRQPLLLRFNWSRMTTAAHWSVISLAYCCWQARFTPSIRTNVSLSTCIPPGEYKTAPRRLVSKRLRKPRMAIFGSRLFPAICTDLTVFGFFLGLCLRRSNDQQIVNVYGDHAGGLWVLGEREIVHLKGGVVTSHFDVDGLQQFQQISEDPDGSLWVVRGGSRFRRAPLPYYRRSGQVFRKV